MAKEYIISDFLKRIKRPVELENQVEYKLVTVKLYHNGVILREYKKGGEIKSNMFLVKTGDFILSGIDARNGAFGIISEDLNNAIVTNDFWYFEIDENIILKELFLELTATAWFDEICKRGSDGTTQRIRLQKDKFFNQSVWLPERDAQKEILNKIKLVKKNLELFENENIKQNNTLTKLRQSILQEAIQGKLTAAWREQNPNVEPAAELLKRIKALRQKAESRKEKTLAPITKNGMPFELPEGWGWCRLGEIFSSTSGGTPNRANVKYWNGNIQWYKSGELNDAVLEKESEEKITELGLNESSATMFPKGTLLIAMYGATAGKLSVLCRDATTNQAICGFYKNDMIETKYLFYFLMANRNKMIEDSWGMSQPNISQTYLRNFVFALPPLSEQQAIVEKVEDLMGKCDQLQVEIENLSKYSKELLKGVFNETFEKKYIFAQP